jgi:diguanylate cyclase (GGDEF)-like protein
MGSVGLIYLDLNDFKPINDIHGHDVGDKLLQVVARRLQGAVRPSDLAARLGGDEFVVVCEDLNSVGGMERLAERLRILLSQPVAVGHRQLMATASIGAVRSQPGDDASTLLDRADREMYEAKRHFHQERQVETATSRSTNSTAPASA